MSLTGESLGLNHEVAMVLFNLIFEIGVPDMPFLSIRLPKEFRVNKIHLFKDIEQKEISLLLLELLKDLMVLIKHFLNVINSISRWKRINRGRP